MRLIGTDRPTPARQHEQHDGRRRENKEEERGSEDRTSATDVKPVTTTVSPSACRRRRERRPQTRRGLSHLTTEVDCESLFSQAGHQSHPERGRTIAETFERLVIGKHRLSCIFCCQTKVLNEFLERWHKKSWSKEEDRDDVEFWSQQKEEYLKQNPSHTGMFDDLNEGNKKLLKLMTKMDNSSFVM